MTLLEQRILGNLNEILHSEQQPSPANPPALTFALPQPPPPSLGASQSGHGYSEFPSVPNPNVKIPSSLQSYFPHAETQSVTELSVDVGQLPAVTPRQSHIPLLVLDAHGQLVASWDKRVTELERAIFDLGLDIQINDPSPKDELRCADSDRILSRADTIHRQLDNLTREIEEKQPVHLRQLDQLQRQLYADLDQQQSLEQSLKHRIEDTIRGFRANLGTLDVPDAQVAKASAEQLTTQLLALQSAVSSLTRDHAEAILNLKASRHDQLQDARKAVADRAKTRLEQIRSKFSDSLNQLNSRCLSEIEAALQAQDRNRDIVVWTYQHELVPSLDRASTYLEKLRDISSRLETRLAERQAESRNWKYPGVDKFSAALLSDMTGIYAKDTRKLSVALDIIARLLEKKGSVETEDVETLATISEQLDRSLEQLFPGARVCQMIDAWAYSLFRHYTFLMKVAKENDETPDLETAITWYKQALSVVKNLRQRCPELQQGYDKLRHVLAAIGKYYDAANLGNLERLHKTREAKIADIRDHFEAARRRLHHLADDRLKQNEAQIAANFRELEHRNDALLRQSKEDIEAKIKLLQSALGDLSEKVRYSQMIPAPTKETLIHSLDMIKSLFPELRQAQGAATESAENVEKLRETKKQIEALDQRLALLRDRYERTKGVLSTIKSYFGETSELGEGAHVFTLEVNVLGPFDREGTEQSLSESDATPGNAPRSSAASTGPNLVRAEATLGPSRQETIVAIRPEEEVPEITKGETFIFENATKANTAKIAFVDVATRNKIGTLIVKLEDLEAGEWADVAPGWDGSERYFVIAKARMLHAGQP